MGLMFMKKRNTTSFEAVAANTTANANANSNASAKASKKASGGGLLPIKESFEALNFDP